VSSIYEVTRAALRNFAGEKVGERVRPDFLPASDALPAIAFQVTGIEPTECLSGDGPKQYALTIWVVAATRAEAAEIAGRMLGLDGHTTQGFTFAVEDAGRDDFEERLESGQPVFVSEVKAYAFGD